jgi:hypothetical protein
MCENVTTWIAEADMQQIRIGRKAPIRQHGDRDAVLPLDPRDPDILRAKMLLCRGQATAERAGKPAPHGEPAV